MCIKSSEELSTLPSVALKALKEKGRNTPMKAKTGSQGDKGMLSLAKVLFKIFEPISKIRFHLKIQISGFFWNLKDLGTQAVFFQDGS